MSSIECYFFVNTKKNLELKTNQPVEIPLFRTEEGRYLATCKSHASNLFLEHQTQVFNFLFTALGDPLIKGLTEVANLRPSDPISFLANYLQNFTSDGRQKTSTANKNSKSEPRMESQTPVITNHVKPMPAKPPTAKSGKEIKEKPTENLIDDHGEDFDVTPGMDERGLNAWRLFEY